MTIPREHLERIGQLALAGIQRQFPFQPAHVISRPGEIVEPSSLHPAFFGCYDWHSAVHAHWTLARLVRIEPRLALCTAAVEILQSHLRVANLQTEAAYFEQHPTFERPYGWAWLLRLAAELSAHPNDSVRSCTGAIEILAERVRPLASDYFQRLSHPIRTGTHFNSAYSLDMMINASGSKEETFRAQLESRARAMFADDHDWPFWIEPSGDDFLSSGLCALTLMTTNALAGTDFATRFCSRDDIVNLKPLVPEDVTDGKTAHLAGLNLSRAAMMCRLSMLDGRPFGDGLFGTAGDHLRAGLAFLAFDSYSTTHWLGTFALDALELHQAAAGQSGIA